MSQIGQQLMGIKGITDHGALTGLADDDHTQYILNIGTRANVQAILQNNANNVVVEIDNDGTDIGLYIHQDGVLAGARYALYIYSNAEQDTSQLVRIQQDNAASGNYMCHFINDGTGNALRIDQNGVLTAGNHGIFLYSNAIQINAPLLMIIQANANSTHYAAHITNYGQGMGLRIDQHTALAAGHSGLMVYSNAVQVNSPLIQIWLDHVDSTQPALYVRHDGTTPNQKIIQVYRGAVELFYLDEDGDIWHAGKITSAGCPDFAELGITPREFIDECKAKVDPVKDEQGADVCDICGQPFTKEGHDEATYKEHWQEHKKQHYHTTQEEVWALMHLVLEQQTRIEQLEVKIGGVN